MGRAPCCDKASVKRGPWSPEEDELLRSYVRTHGAVSNWIALPHKAGVNRCGKSCRLRWLNYLRPDIKHGGYTEQEDLVICSLYNSIGSRWSIIASKLPGRTDNDVKNYWNTKLKKKAMAMHNQHHYHHHHGPGRATPIATPPPAPSSYMQPSPASASSAVTTASGDAYSSFGATTAYSPSNQAQTQAHLAHYNNVNAAASAPLAEFPTPAVASSWAINMAFDDMFLPELVGAGEFPSGEDLFGGFGTLLQDSRAPSTLQELSACYFPNAQAEMWADVKPPPPPPGAGLCPSLT
ncbi:hypothetical protein QYE76_054622 [Lolium multiflorum]|uniref:Uncharacterized protein n=1 Tax=Lolium multiflorum TaxID=4521 RepID=A0AAD8SY24_LOLMU|nr:hypothetical protein QYE76_054622 [Lolium multiflorum]